MPVSVTLGLIPTVKVQSAAMVDVMQPSALDRSPTRGRVVRRLGKNLLCALATGYILFLFSERMFWTVWRPDDSLVEQIITWLAYSVAAYLFLAAVSWSRANDAWSIFLAGALYGWIVEGGLIHTLYGTEASAPFPLSISITGLSWHSLISVMLGWWATGRALTATSPRQLVWVSLTIGVFWGIWAMFPRRETPPVLTSVPAFLLNAGLLTLGLVASWWISFRAGLREFRPGRLGTLSCAMIVGLFFSQHVLRLGMLPLLVFPSVLGFALVMLSLHRRYTQCSPATELFPGSCHSHWLPMIGLIPCVATTVYWLAVACHLDRLPVSTIVYYGLTGPMGFLMLILATQVTIRRVRASTTAAS